jgi:hypothetical protein
MDIIEESLAQLGSQGPDTRIRALVPFSARLQQDLALLVGPPSFVEADFNSPQGLRWEGTSVTTRNSQGNFKLYLCRRRGLAIWIPYGEWFTSNQTPTAAQTIGELALQTNRHKPARGGGGPRSY